MMMGRGQEFALIRVGVRRLACPLGWTNGGSFECLPGGYLQHTINYTNQKHQQQQQQIINLLKAIKKGSHFIRPFTFGAYLASLWGAQTVRRWAPAVEHRRPGSLSHLIRHKRKGNVRLMAD